MDPMPLVTSEEPECKTHNDACKLVRDDSDNELDIDIDIFKSESNDCGAFRRYY